MPAQQIPISLWMLAFALAGGGIDYLRVRRLDRRVLCFFSLAGLAAGAAFRWTAERWGLPAGLAAAAAALAAIGLGSRAFIREHIVRLDRKEVSGPAGEELEKLREEARRERAELEAAGKAVPTLRELLLGERGRRKDGGRRQERTPPRETAPADAGAQDAKEGPK